MIDLDGLYRVRVTKYLHYKFILEREKERERERERGRRDRDR